MKITKAKRLTARELEKVSELQEQLLKEGYTFCQDLTDVYIYRNNEGNIGLQAYENDGEPETILWLN